MVNAGVPFATGNLVLGGNVFGWTASEDASHRVLDRYLEQGGVMIDTADGYSHWAEGNAGGESETIIGSWLASRGAQSRVRIATKVSTHPEYQGLAALTVRRAAEASLTRLGVDEIDLYWAHFDDPSVPIVETAAAFSALKTAGKIRAIGLSNYSSDRIAEWFRVARAEGLELPVALQPHYNLVEREFETSGLREIAEVEGLSVYPYYALASGFLTGKYRSLNDAQAVSASPRAQAASAYLERGGDRVLEVLQRIAAAHETTLTATALAWLRQQPTIAAPIASARTEEQLAALIESTRLELTEGELADLQAVSAEMRPAA